MYINVIMMVAFLSLLHVVHGKGIKGDVLNSAVSSMIGSVFDALMSGAIQSSKGRKQECVQCIDARVEQENLRANENIYRTPKCADAETADELNNITLQSCVDVPNDAYISRCGYLDGDIKLTIDNDEASLHLHVRGCLKFDQGTAEGCSSDRDVINKQIARLDIKTRIIGVGTSLNVTIKIAEINGRLCNNVDATVDASRTWWIIWYVVLANFLLR